jgi:signal peptidase II
VAIGVIFLYLCKPGYSRDRLTNVALSLILAGAAGNLLDRLIFGYVRDFLDFRIWPVFNLADSAVSVGTMLLGWRILRPK